MKTTKSLLMVLVMLVMFTACQTKVKKENEALKAKVDSLNAQIDSLKGVSNQNIVSIENYESILAEIDSNLASINANQSMVASLKDELDQSNSNEVAESINDKIINIKALMESSRNKIVSLDKSLKQLRQKSGAQSEEILALDQKLAEASQSLIQKQTEMDELRTSLEKQLENLGVALENQISIAAELKRNLNRAYYIAADAKTLTEKQIVTKEGGFIGLGKVKVINANADNTLFVKTSKEELSTIELNGKKAALITSHPEGSYEFVGTDKSVERINILDAQAFWKDSNYLVIELK